MQKEKDIRGEQTASAGLRRTSEGRRMFAIIAVALMLGAVLVGALAIMSIPEGTIFIGEKTHADSVTVYQNGVTFVTYSENISIYDDSTVLQFYLPAGVILDSLRIEGITVLDIRSRGEEPALMPGDIVVLNTDKGRYSGTFQGWESGGVVISRDNKTSVIYDDIEEIEIVDPFPPRPGEISVNATVVGEPGVHEIRVSYLMRGVSWRASYFLDLDSSEISCWATLRGVETWKDIQLKIVSGGPHIVYRPTPYRGLVYNGLYRDSISANSSSDGGESGNSWSSEDLGEYHEYTLDRKISLYKGETTKIPLFSGKVNLRQEYYWSGSSYYYSYDRGRDVMNRYHINNTLSEPLPAGIVECYMSDSWVGEDRLKYTPVGDESTVIVGYAKDVKISVTTTQSDWEKVDYYTSRYTYSGEIEIRNFKSQEISVHIEVYTSVDSDIRYSGTPQPTYENGKLMWDITVPAGGSSTIDYTYSYTT